MYAEKHLNTTKREKERREKDTIFVKVERLVEWGDDELVFMGFIFECVWILLMQKNGRGSDILMTGEEGF